MQAVEEQAAERLRQRVNGEQEVGFAGDPSLAVEGDAAAGDKTMDMRVVGQRLPPGVQHGDEADLAPRRSAARSVSACAAARISSPYAICLFWKAISAAAGGRVKTT